MRAAAPALLLASLVAALPADIEARQSAVQCYSGVYVIYARGTGEPQGSSLSNIIANAIVAQIPGSGADQVVYPANFDPTSEYQGYTNAKNQAQNYAAACPTGKIVMMGYSQGASAVGDAIANGLPSASVNAAVANNIVSVIMFGDPGQNNDLGTSQFEDNPCKNSALFPRSLAAKDQMAKYTDRLVEVCAAGDPVCCALGSNVYDHIGYFTNERAAAIAGFVAGKFGSS